jgi:hypothetical protein
MYRCVCIVRTSSSFLSAFCATNTFSRPAISPTAADIPIALNLCFALSSRVFWAVLCSAQVELEGGGRARGVPLGISSDRYCGPSSCIKDERMPAGRRVEGLSSVTMKQEPSTEQVRSRDESDEKARAHRGASCSFSCGCVGG